VTRNFMSTAPSITSPLPIDRVSDASLCGRYSLVFETISTIYD
jgi:hypothetical protein